MKLVRQDFESMTMDKRKKEKLAKKGWKVGSVAEFLDLPAEESAYIEMKLASLLALGVSKKELGRTIS